MIEITSEANLQFKIFLSLGESKGLKKEKLFLLSGKNLVQEYLERSPLNPKFIAEILTEDLPSLTFDRPNSQVFKLSKSLFKQIDVLGTHWPILVLEQPQIPEWNSTSLFPDLLVATPLGDPSNLGALIRSAEAFGIKDMILLKESAHPFLPKAVKASAGSVLRMHFHRGPNLQDFSLTQGSNLIGLDMNGTALQKFQWPTKGILLLGEEGPGLPKSKTMKTIRIPTEKVESLNATVAASIALYDFYLKSKQIQNRS